MQMPNVFNQNNSGTTYNRFITKTFLMRLRTFETNPTITRLKENLTPRHQIFEADKIFWGTNSEHADKNSGQMKDTF